MTLRLSKDVLAAAYDFLNETEPFIRWGLPHSEDVTFKVIKTTQWFADVDMVQGKFRLRVSSGANGHTLTLLSTLSHEMCHMRQFLLGDTANHNALFNKLAKDVSKVHGFDVKAF